MKNFFLLACLFAALAFSTNSCTSIIVEEEEEVTPVNPDDGEINRSFIVSFSANFSGKINSYAYVDMKPSVPAINWSNVNVKAELNAGLFLKGDSLGQALLPDNHSLTINSSGNAVASATITVKTKEKRGTMYAYYPHQTTVSGTTLTYKLNNVQDQSVADSLMDSALNSNMLMISDPVSNFVLNGGKPIVNLKNVFSILRFRINLSSEMTFLRPVTKITVYIANKDNLEVPLSYKLAGDYTIDLSKAPESSGYAGPQFSASNFSNTITAQISNSPNISYSSINPSIWLIANPNQISANDRLVAVIDLGGYKIISQHEIAELKPNTIHDIHVVSKNDNTVSDQYKYFLKNNAANCYIIPQAGFWQIPLYKVNGESLSGKGDAVVWLWASKEKGGNSFSINELIDPSTLIKHDSTEVDNGNHNYIRFRVGTAFGKFTKGNVVLALKKGNEIIWSWHIWITDQPKDLEHQDNKTFLDRNLGALSAQGGGTSPVDNYGFVYQWGRKDPFFGGDGRTNETTTTPLALATNNTIRNGVSWQRTQSIQTRDYARQNPTAFICNNTSSTILDEPVDWLSGSSIPIRWAEATKADNDPCPPGYRVPNRNDLRILQDADTLNKPTNPNLSFVTAGFWHWEYFYRKNTSTSITSHWPAAGMRIGRWSFRGNAGSQLLDSGTDAGRGQCYYWTSSPVMLGDVVLQGGSHRVHTAGARLYSADDFGDNADAYPVRCIKML